MRTPVSIAVNGDIIVALQVREGDLDRCSADKQALREFYKQAEKPTIRAK